MINKGKKKKHTTFIISWWPMVKVSASQPKRHGFKANMESRQQFLI